MTVDALFAVATASMGGILSDAFTAMMAIVNILLVLAGGRIVYAVITNQSVIPESLTMERYDESEYESMVDQEEKKYHQGIMRNNAKLEVQDRHKYDL